MAQEDEEFMFGEDDEEDLKKTAKDLEQLKDDMVKRTTDIMMTPKRKETLVRITQKSFRKKGIPFTTQYIKSYCLGFNNGIEASFLSQHDRVFVEMINQVLRDIYQEQEKKLSKKAQEAVDNMKVDDQPKV